MSYPSPHQRTSPRGVEREQAFHVAAGERETQGTSTRFCIGSMGKLFTAVAIMQLVEQGRLGLSDPLARHLEPGSRWGYNNDGFVLLGAILERVTGKPYEAVFHERIFGPAGMPATSQAFASSRATAVPAWRCGPATARPTSLRPRPPPSEWAWVALAGLMPLTARTPASGGSHPRSGASSAGACRACCSSCGSRPPPRRAPGTSPPRCRRCRP